MTTKTHLGQLLDRLAKGEKILITRNGKTVAMLVSAPPVQKKDLKRIIQRFKDYSKKQGRSLKGITPHELIEEGRRF